MQTFYFLSFFVFSLKKNIDVELIEKEIRKKMAAAQPMAGAAKINRCQSVC